LSDSVRWEKKIYVSQHDCSKDWINSLWTVPQSIWGEVNWSTFI
jgi:hypothetical protein